MNSESKRPNFGHFLDVAQSAAFQAGEFLVSQMGKVDVSEKNPGDFVTQADFESQKIIKDIILHQFPDHQFLGEETDDETDSRPTIAADEYCWIVDPLDGTTNYIHQLRSFSISIALQYNGEILAGCVHDPILMETYSATLHGGSTLNGEAIQTSQQTSTRQSIVVCSLPSQLKRDSPELHRMINVLCDSEATLRRLGSAALNLSYIACGRVDSYWSTFAKIWDIAAGVLILTEAGGTITRIDGQPLDWSDLAFVASSTDELNEEMIKCLSIE